MNFLLKSLHDAIRLFVPIEYSPNTQLLKRFRTQFVRKHSFQFRHYFVLLDSPKLLNTWRLFLSNRLHTDHAGPVTLATASATLQKNLSLNLSGAILSRTARTGSLALAITKLIW